MNSMADSSSSPDQLSKEPLLETTVPHHPISFFPQAILSTDRDSEDYLRKLALWNYGKAELRRNVEVMNECVKGFLSSMNAEIDYLVRYGDNWIQQVAIEREQLVKSIETAIQEAEYCFGNRVAPSSPLVQALLLGQEENLHLFTYTLSPPKSHSTCHCSYQIAFPSGPAPFQPPPVLIGGPSVPTTPSFPRCNHCYQTITTETMLCPNHCYCSLCEWRLYYHGSALLLRCRKCQREINTERLGKQSCGGCKREFPYNLLFFYCAACKLAACETCARGKLLCALKECAKQGKPHEMSVHKWESIGAK